MGTKPLKQVAAFDLERVKKNMQAAGKAPRTIQYVLATFRQVWNMARRDGLVSGDSPTKAVKLPKVNNSRDRFLTRQEADALFARLKETDRTCYHIAALSIFTGMRAEEIFRLTWRDIDRLKGHIRIADPKNSESRHAFITEPVKAILDELEEGEPEKPIFAHSKGLPYTEAPYSFRKAVKALGFNDGLIDKRQRVCFHTLRHTFGSWLAESGVNLYTIGKLMGHKTPAMTARYAHLGPGALRDAAGVLAIMQKPNPADIAEGKS